jgi:hypothetical protein
MGAGNNLISYPFATAANVADALGNAAGDVYALAGEGQAALNISGNWVGSLQAFEGGNGYWLVATNDFSFSFSGLGSLTRAEVAEVRTLPLEYSVTQSEQQAFFFVNSAKILGEDLSDNDIIIAYNDDAIVGARYWSGEYTDVPAMGFDSFSADRTADYCTPGDVVTFKVLVASTGQLVEMDADIEAIWTSDLSMPVLNLTDTLPLEVSLNDAYPNPFNPTTTLNYVVPSNMNVSLAIYDMRGRLVEELVNNMHERGNHHVVWNADIYASGVYMVKLTAGSSVQVQKLMLIK